MAVGVCSSSIMRSSLRSISSRRRRISERVSSEVMAEPQGRGPILRLGGCGWGLKLAERIKTRPSSLCSGGRSVLCSLLLPTSPSGRYPLVALTLSGDLFLFAKHLFVAEGRAPPHEANRQHKGRVPWLPSRDFDCAFLATGFGSKAIRSGPKQRPRRADGARFLS